MDKLEGTIATITYQNADNGFTVIQLQTTTQNPVTCVGTMPTVRKGESVVMEGEWQRHKKFGQQFKISSFSIVKPATLEGIEQLLGSGYIANIGEVRARQITATFGLDTLHILDNEPRRLTEVPGIGPKTVQKIIDGWESQRKMRQLMLFLQDYGVSVNMVSRIYKAWGAEAQSKICQNPYALIDSVWGIGFVKADAIARKLNFGHDSYKRIRAGLTFTLQEACGDGHCFLPSQDLTEKASQLLQVKDELITFSLDHAIKASLFIQEGDAIYLPWLYKAESKTASLLQEKIWAPFSDSNRFDQPIEPWLENYRRESGWIGAPEQVEAIKSATRNKLLLLTGGPGTGKTTVLQVIVAYFAQMGLKVKLAAPTGRAAQRMGSISGYKARTIHRLLQYKPGEGPYSFVKNEEEPLDADVIILDEVSMVDIMLMKSFLSAVPRDCHLIFVGDNNQLPSVGAGNVLGDLIGSGSLPHVHLKQIFRQAAESRIVCAAHEIIQGNVPHFKNAKVDNCFFLHEEDPHQSVQTIVELVSKRLPARYGFDPSDDIQLLSPMHKGIIGTANLNTALQQKINTNTLKITHGQAVFTLGDKVMQIKNNYDLGVFNGDIGKICAVTEDAVTVDFQGNTVIYESGNLDELTLAYCISIHKSQGCEFKAVIIPVSTQHYVMLQRNLIYTAITRARELCVLIGTANALKIAVKNDEALNRFSRLGDLIKA
ncbi:ATP-dependent RecD-like DNA helicase [Chitinispirillales bacterium ANBcel5]|uniref:SF1B family DNA helicase RecD2 n=1 Tax=Cellulosispirillum alkaliphilum TaxID=3039283 RepID=UPI002A503456|nr:ATP-dependent RecD-like DNA helicase [Chitinispirillales bacterium ANBcel5]